MQLSGRAMRQIYWLSLSIAASCFLMGGGDEAGPVQYRDVGSVGCKSPKLVCLSSFGFAMSFFLITFAENPVYMDNSWTDVSLFSAFAFSETSGWP